MSMILALLASLPQTSLPTASDLGTLYGTVQFSKTPTSAEIQRSTPNNLNAEVVVRIKCSVSDTGYLVNCSGAKDNKNNDVLISALSLTKFYRLPITPKGLFILKPWVWLDIRFSTTKDGAPLPKEKCTPPYCVNEPLIN